MGPRSEDFTRSSHQRLNPGDSMRIRQFRFPLQVLPTATEVSFPRRYDHSSHDFVCLNWQKLLWRSCGTLIGWAECKRREWEETSSSQAGRTRGGTDYIRGCEGRFGDCQRNSNSTGRLHWWLAEQVWWTCCNCSSFWVDALTILGIRDQSIRILQKIHVCATLVYVRWLGGPASFQDTRSWTMSCHMPFA